MYKLLAIDLDGSLLDLDHEISEKNKKTIKKCLDQGIKVTLLSGREIYSISDFAKELNTKELIAGYNGSIITDVSGKEIIFNQTIDKSLAKQIIDFNKRREDFIILFVGNEILVNDGESNHFKTFIKYTKTKPIVVDDLSSYLEENGKFSSINKICLSNNHEKLLESQDQVDKLVDKELTTLFSLPIFLEIFNKTVSKGLALEKIASHYNIRREEILAIGDGENDISMIEYAGFGVAMENASEKLKEVSDYITLGNDKDGVSIALEKFVL